MADFNVRLRKLKLLGTVTDLTDVCRLASVALAADQHHSFLSENEGYALAQLRARAEACRDLIDDTVECFRARLED